MTWAGERSEQPRSFQSPEMFFLLTLPFIERALVKSDVDESPELSATRKLPWTMLLSPDKSCRLGWKPLIGICPVSVLTWS